MIRDHRLDIGRSRGREIRRNTFILQSPIHHHHHHVMQEDSSCQRPCNYDDPESSQQDVAARCATPETFYVHHHVSPHHATNLAAPAARPSTLTVRMIIAIVGVAFVVALAMCMTSALILRDMPRRSFPSHNRVEQAIALLTEQIDSDSLNALNETKHEYTHHRASRHVVASRHGERATDRLLRKN